MAVPQSWRRRARALPGSGGGEPASSTVANFDSRVDAYDSARPAYPPAVYDALEAATRQLADATVIEGGAGTGLATAALVERGANVIAFDIGEQMLLRAGAHAPGAVMVVADGNRLPFADRAADLICFAQSWHWLDVTGPAQREAARVLYPDGWWAGWWSHARADGHAWFDTYQDVLEAGCPSYQRSRRDTDWGASILTGGHFHPPVKTVISWERQCTIEQWLTDERSHSYFSELSQVEEQRLLTRLRDVLTGQFPDGSVRCEYSTWLWTAAVRV